jgi:hypothetical protein
VITDEELIEGLLSACRRVSTTIPLLAFCLWDHHAFECLGPSSRHAEEQFAELLAICLVRPAKAFPGVLLVVVMGFLPHVQKSQIFTPVRESSGESRLRREIHVMDAQELLLRNIRACAPKAKRAMGSNVHAQSGV